MLRGVSGFLLVVGVSLIALVAQTAAAAPSIAITAPPAGQLTELRPTISVGYSTDDAPLDLSSFRLLVNGVDWTGRFTVGPDSASYVVSAADELIPGALRVEASVSDQAAPPVAATDVKTYDVLPTFQALTPLVGRPGDTITIAALGLDPDVAHDRFVFASLSSANGITVPLATVDRPANRATVVVPDGAITGPVFLEVNGQRARQAFTFVVRSALPICGWKALEILPLLDESTIVHYQEYDGGNSVINIDAQCPALVQPTCVFSVRCGATTRTFPDGSAQLLIQQRLGSSGPGIVLLDRTAVDKTGTGFALLYSQGPNSFNLTSRVQYKGAISLLPGFRFASGADFAKDGSLYMAFAGTPGNLYRLTREQLESGGAQTPSLVASNLGGPEDEVSDVVVTCDGSAYVATNSFGSGSISSAVRRLDLASGQVVADLPLAKEIRDLFLSSNDAEVWALALTDSTRTQSELWHIPVTPTPPAIGPLEVMETFAMDSYATGVTSDGAVYAGHQFIGIYGASTTIAPRDVGAGLTTALPVCPTAPEAISVLTSTTRWKPQRSDDPITVVAGSSVELDTAQPFTLRYTGKKPDGSVVAAQTEITLPATALAIPPQGYAHGYSLTWNHQDGIGAKLPAGNYTLLVKAPVLSNQSRVPPPLESPEYDKVSLVEVVAITIEDASGVAIPNNPPTHGGGKRIFAEAAQPGGTVTDKLKVTATILPPVTDAPAGQGVVVHFKSFDVDDPTSSTAPVDDESWPTDNCLEASAGPPQNCPVADPGLLYDITADPNAQNPAASGILEIAATGNQATAGLRVAMLAGANYRVVASTSLQWLGTLSAPGNRTDGAVLEGRRC